MIWAGSASQTVEEKLGLTRLRLDQKDEADTAPLSTAILRLHCTRERYLGGLLDQTHSSKKDIEEASVHARSRMVLYPQAYIVASSVPYSTQRFWIVSMAFIDSRF